MKVRRTDGGSSPPGNPSPGAPVGPSLYYSPSRLSTHDQCPRRYRYRYVDRRPERVRSAEAVVGDVVHDVVRRLYAYVQGEGRVPSLEAVLARTRAVFAETWVPEVSIVARGMTRQLYATNAERFVANFYARNEPFADHSVMLEGRVEAPLGMLGERKVVGFGYADRVSLNGDHYTVHDFKSGKRVLTQPEAERDGQLALYALGLQHSRLPAAPGPTQLIWHFVAYGVEVNSTADPRRLDALRREMLERVVQVEADTTYPARPGPLCSWCDFRSICPDAR